MGTGNLQIISRGAEDVYLTGNPQFTYFKTAYKKHTMFSIQKMEVSDSTNVSFGQTIRYRINKNGDLLKGVFLELKIKGLKQDQGGASYVGYTNSFFTSLIDYVEIEINGDRIDRLDGEYIDMYNELFLNEGKRVGHDSMIGKYENTSAIQFNALNDEYTYYLPLPFWFGEDIGNALPLIALQYSDITISVKLREAREVVKSDVELTSVLDKEGGVLQIDTLRLYGDYINLDTEERKLFAENTHSYLIRQHQTNKEMIEANVNIKKVELSFQHPIRYILWAVRKKVDVNTQTGNEWVNYSQASGLNPVSSASIRINGIEHVESSDGDYYVKVVPYSHFKNMPRKFVHSYSFALDPTDWKPSGHFNFSKVDKKQLLLRLRETSDEQEVLVYSENYNLMRIKSGLAGLAFTNV
jgi:hypothetical protein